MSFSRRNFLIGCSVLSFWTIASRLRGSEPTKDSDKIEVMLKHWMDTLLPTDAYSPGAGQLGVHLEVLDKAKMKKQYFQLLLIGMKWSDAEAVKLGADGFAQLSSEQAVEIVKKAEAMGLRTMPGLFFYHTLNDGKLIYYSNKGSWSGVGFPHTPQPLGFMDYTKAPKL